jgi:hypothetical protein
MWVYYYYYYFSESTIWLAQRAVWIRFAVIGKHQVVDSVHETIDFGLLFRVLPVRQRQQRCREPGKLKHRNLISSHSSPLVAFHFTSFARVANRRLDIHSFVRFVHFVLFVRTNARLIGGRSAREARGRQTPAAPAPTLGMRVPTSISIVIVVVCCRCRRCFVFALFVRSCKPFRLPIITCVIAYG